MIKELRVYSKKVENYEILVAAVIARRFMPKQSKLSEGIASLRFTPLAMTILIIGI
jgi:hypothetical protein